MAARSLTHEKMVETALLIQKHGTVRAAATEAASRFGISIHTFESRAKAAKRDGYWWWDGSGGVCVRPEAAISTRPHAAAAVPVAPDLPDDDISTEDLITLLRKRFEKRKAHADAKVWRRFDVPTSGPYGVMLWGDPHLDDNGTDWTLVASHSELAARTPHLYSVNLGDTTNNWGGSLVRLWANQDTSHQTARKLVKWFLNDAGIRWFLWLYGNHDLMPGPVGPDALERFKPHHIAIEEWGAKVTLVSPNGTEFRMHVAHDFPGHSQWNPLHGPQKNALMGDHANLYAAGHKHNWALYAGEHEHRKTVYWLARARGYKTVDDYGARLGYGSQAHGHSIVAVVDPSAHGPGHVTCFADPCEGAAFLTWKRKRSA